VYTTNTPTGHYVGWCSKSAKDDNRVKRTEFKIVPTLCKCLKNVTTWRIAHIIIDLQRRLCQKIKYWN
jgi:hypothetical protein